MQNPKDFTGLPMPVFTAFGWEGEENALKYALSELELFITALYNRLPAPARAEFQTYGLSTEGQNAYLSTGTTYDDEAFIAFNARPMSFEILFGITDKTALSKGLAAVNKDLPAAHHALMQLDPGWTLRIQQMQIDEDTGERAHHQDLYKDSVVNLSEETAAEVFARAAYLNEEDLWVTPVYLSMRIPSDRVAAMDSTILTVSADLVMALVPVLNALLGRKPKKKAKKTSKPKAAPVVTGPTVISEGEDRASAATLTDSADSFTYVSELMPLHLRRGFINLTTAHWPFFALNARAQTRDVTVVFDGRQDRHCSVWRLQPDDQARLVLGPQVHDWVEENFASSDHVQVTARKLDNDEIRITLEPVA
ncbi:MAG: hypothetical protein R3C44_11010 [Chloroflexota bacterium]